MDGVLKEDICRALRDPDHQARIKRWIENGRAIRILVTGKTGAGKTTLVNAIIGADVEQAGESLDPETKEVREFQVDIDGVTVTVFDSPGLQDGTGNEKQCLADMERKCKEVDLVLYCNSMNENRILEGDIRAVAQLTQALGESFWKRTIFVLTFADKVKLPPNTKETECDFFAKRVEQWEDALRSLIARQPGVSQDTAQNIPVVPTGASSPTTWPGCDNWLANLWFACLERTSPDAQPALLRINWKRLKPVELLKRGDTESAKPYDQPIPVSLESPFVVFGRSILQTAEPLVREFLGIQAQAMEVGLLGRQVGSYVGRGFGAFGGEVGGTLGAILTQLVAQYVKKHLK